MRLRSKGYTFRQISNVLGMHYSTVSRWLQTLRPSIRKTKAGRLENVSVLETIKSFLLANPFATCADVRKEVQSQCNVLASIELVRLAMHKAGFRRKKPHFYPQPTVANDRVGTFLQQREALTGHKIIAIDEVGFSANVRPTVGYARLGKRLHVRYRPNAQERKHVSVVAATDGQTGAVHFEQRIGYYTTNTFVAFLQKLEANRGTVLLLDNVRFHHSAQVKELAEQRGWTLLYTPPYSPWFNPIERVFALVKRHYRKHRDIVAAFQALEPSVILRIMASRGLEGI